MRGGVTGAGQPNEQTIREDRATQPMEAGGWVLQYKSLNWIDRIVSFHTQI